MTNTTLVTTLVVSSLTASVILIATKHHVVSLAPSILASVLVIFALLPQETTGGEQTTYAYSAGGGVRVAKKQKTPTSQPIQHPHQPTSQPIQHPHQPTSQPIQHPHQPIQHQPTQSLPVCEPTPPQPTNQQMKDHIRDNGLYGVHGNLSCKRLQRGTVEDSGLLQPLNARNQLLKYLSVDQQHAKDPYLISRKGRGGM